MEKHSFKPIGKLKKGTQFMHFGKEFKITKSGYGTGKYVLVDFESIDPTDNRTYCLSKKTDVEVTNFSPK